MLDLQKAGMLKRISAFILDFIVIIICVTGFSLLLSFILNFDTHVDNLEKYKEQIEEEYNVNIVISGEEYNSLSTEDKERLDIAQKTLFEDENFIKESSIVINLILVIISISILLAYAISEFIIPLIFGHGQTLGKKVFSLAVMRTNHIRISNKNLFIRAILGKYTMETMFIVMLFLMSILGILGFVGTAVIFLMLVLQICLLIFTKNNCAIHDILSDTVVVDLSSQMIFESEKELLEFQKSLHEEKVKNYKY